MELRIMPSDPGFRGVEFIANWIAKLTPALAGGARENAQLLHDLKHMPEIERLVCLKDLEDLFKQLTH